VAQQKVTIANLEKDVEKYQSFQNRYETLISDISKTDTDT
jgi:hypothetical protein